MASVHTVCVADRKGVKKHPVESIVLVVGYGVAGDAHGGSGRQVSLLALEDMEIMRAKLSTLQPGDFAENILVDGLSALDLPVGGRVRVGGTALLEITQIGKECHRGCEIRKAVGECIMPKRGLFAKVVEPGTIRSGDAVVSLAPANFSPEI